jgi:hypothetical protein
VNGSLDDHQIDLTTGADVPGIDQATFAKVAERPMGCPGLAGPRAVKITLDATLEGLRLSEPIHANFKQPG